MPGRSPRARPGRRPRSRGHRCGGRTRSATGCAGPRPRLVATGATDERVGGRHGIAQRPAAIGIDGVDAQQLAQQRPMSCPVCRRITGAAAITHADVEEAVRPEGEVAAVVVGRRLVDGQDHPPRARVGPARVPSAVLSHDRVAAMRRRCRARVVDVEEAVARRSQDGRPAPVGPALRRRRAAMTGAQVEERRPACRQCPVLVGGAQDAPRLFDDEDDAPATRARGVTSTGRCSRPGWAPARPGSRRGCDGAGPPPAGSPAGRRRRGPRWPGQCAHLLASGGTRCLPRSVRMRRTSRPEAAVQALADRPSSADRSRCGCRHLQRPAARSAAP